MLSELDVPVALSKDAPRLNWSLSSRNFVTALVVDSVAALTPRAEIEGEMGDVQPGLQARLMSQALRKLTASISRSNVRAAGRRRRWLACARCSGPASG